MREKGCFLHSIRRKLDVRLAKSSKEESFFSFARNPNRRKEVSLEKKIFPFQTFLSNGALKGCLDVKKLGFKIIYSMYCLCGTRGSLGVGGFSN